MNKIGLLSDSDFTSLPLMKLSAYHKKLGDSVKLVDTNLEKFDKLYISKVFNLNLQKINKFLYIPYADEIITGGSGYAIKTINGREVYTKENDPDFSPEIENCFPDYSLYGEKTTDTAHGFLTRGCPNCCGFCIVCKKDGTTSRKVADLSSFWDKQKIIKLYDANILACQEREELLKQLINSGAKIDFTQGLDARLMDVTAAKMIEKMRVSVVHFAFDLIKNEKQIIEGLRIFSKYFTKGERYKKVYILTNYNTTFQEDYYRVKRVLELGYCPYVMIYQKGTHPQFLTDLARWCNNNFILYSTDFENYIPRADGRSIKELYPDILKDWRSYA